MIRIHLRSTSLFIALACALVTGAAAGAESPPAWAYVANPPDFKLSPDDGATRRVPGSSAGYTLTQTRDRFLAPDWHAADYPPLPEVVARGRKPDVFACGFCHRADGPGGPENANLTGLPASYIVQQMLDFKSGARKSAVPALGPQTLKATLAKAVTQDEIEAAAAYFSSIKPRAIVRVVEASTVPRTFVAGWFLAASKTGETEPIGQRIIEVPEVLEHFESRDTRARFIAYVPPDSSSKARRSPPLVGVGRQCSARAVTGPASEVWDPFPASQVVRQATSCDNSMITSTARALAREAL